MGCGSSRIVSNSGSIKEVQTPLKKKPSGSEERLDSKNGATVDQRFVALACTPNLVKASFDSTSPVVEEPEEPGKDIETINTWELLAGLEDDEDGDGGEGEEEEEEESCSKSLSSMKQCSEVEGEDGNGVKVEESEQEEEGEKGLRRKAVAAELSARKSPAVEMSRTGSLRDWLIQGGQARPKFGGFEKKMASGSGGDCEVDVFDSGLVAQLEKAMKELTMEEEEILKQIVGRWEGCVRKVF